MAANENVQRRETGSTFGSIIGRLVAASIILAVTAFLTPGFTISNIWALIVAAVVLSVLDYAIAKMFRTDASPFGRGIIGFILAAAIIYSIRFIVPGYNVTLFGAVLAAIVFGIVDAIIPGRAL
ncbi:phage holin family protein [Petroclostridium sp. X23]|jgi:uncharacterized membrane protein YvlD (DUF360 family)|uniref:phage holin family protein n=1 Tax=Petroclostridium sp. X23 TaxID=3045146 RepID=UPI0024ACFBDB|nr:phage holin family protein [Petroclostridium sp. X23]WHH57093.1 phage holin family protein [Petroclostridium sp. X23]